MRERDLLLFVFNKKQQMLRFAQHDRCPFSSACLVWAARGPEYWQVEFDEIIVLTVCGDDFRFEKPLVSGKVEDGVVSS
jgi:hypothetical protein